MATSISRDEVRRLVSEQGAQIVDVLPRWEFDEEHLAGAISIPLKRFDGDSAGALDAARPVILYCHDHL